MTQDELAALSEKATQGRWVPNTVGGGAFSTWHHMPVLEGKAEDVELCCKLVSAYRSGNLAWVGDGAVEAVPVEAVPVETYQRDIGLRDEYAQSLEARATAAEAENAKLREALAIIADGMPQTMYDGTVVNAPISAREAQRISRAALGTDNG